MLVNLLQGLFTHTLNMQTQRLMWGLPRFVVYSWKYLFCLNLHFYYDDATHLLTPSACQVRDNAQQPLPSVNHLPEVDDPLMCSIFKWLKN